MNPMETPDAGATLQAIRRSLRILIRAQVVLYLVVLGLTAWTLITASNIESSLCTFRSDLETRADTTEKLLDENPEAFAEFGLTPEEARGQVDNQRRTIAALGDLDC